MKRIVTALLSLVHGLAVLSHIAFSQSPPDSASNTREVPSWTTGSVTLQAGAAGLGLAELNASLTANGRPAFSTNVATYGVSGYARFGRVVVGGGGESSVPQREVAGGWVSKISFGSAMLDAGVVLVDRAHLLVYPQVSLGIRATSLRLQRSGGFSYDDGVGDPARGVELSSRGALAGVGVVAESHLAMRRTGAFSIGLRAGMLRPLGRPATYAGESTVSGTPREHDGWTVRITVGKPVGKRRDVVSALSTALVSIVAR